MSGRLSSWRRKSSDNAAANSVTYTANMHANEWQARRTRTLLMRSAGHLHHEYHHNGHSCVQTEPPHGGDASDRAKTESREVSQAREGDTGTGLPQSAREGVYELGPTQRGF